MCLSVTGDIDSFTPDVVFLWTAASSHCQRRTANVFVVLKTPKVVEAWRGIGRIDLSVFPWSRVLPALYTSLRVTTRHDSSYQRHLSSWLSNAITHIDRYTSMCRCGRGMTEEEEIAWTGHAGGGYTQILTREAPSYFYFSLCFINVMIHRITFMWRIPPHVRVTRVGAPPRVIEYQTTTSTLESR